MVRFESKATINAARWKSRDAGALHRDCSEIDRRCPNHAVSSLKPHLVEVDNQQNHMDGREGHPLKPQKNIRYSGHSKNGPFRWLLTRRGPAGAQFIGRWREEVDMK
jgi:hypothetical protein